MPDGMPVVLVVSSAACRPALERALGRLLACAEQGASPEEVLRDIRAVMSGHGLLLHGEEGAG